LIANKQPCFKPEEVGHEDLRSCGILRSVD